MINIIKGMMMCKRSRFDNDDTMVTTLFSFRDKKLYIHNSKKLNEPPFLGCVINKAAAKQLIEFLQSCLDEKKCDECWNKEIPACFTVESDLKCHICGEFYK